MLQDFRRERNVKAALKAIARQRVVMVLQPGNVPVIERSPPEEEWFDIGVRTCHIRGWVEVLHKSMPTGQVHLQGNRPMLPERMIPQTHYRLTEGGWAVLNRTQGWVLATFIVSVLGLFVGIGSLAVSLKSPPETGQSSVPKK